MGKKKRIKRDLGLMKLIVLMTGKRPKKGN